MAQFSKIDRLTENIVGPVIVIIALVVAGAVGYFSGHGSIGLIASFVAFVVSLALVISLGRRIWVLVVFSWSLVGTTSLFPMAFRVVDIIVLFVFFAFFALAALKLVRSRPKFDTGDWLVLINMGYLAVTFFRNPVGVSALNSQLVGGRPYFNTFIAFLCYLILRKAAADEKSIRRIPFYILLAATFTALAPMVGTISPAVGGALGEFYSGFAPAAAPAFDSGVAQDTESIGRLGSLSLVAPILMVALCAYFRPMTLLLPAYPGRFFLWLLTITLNLSTGFRSSIIGCAGYMAVGTIYWKRTRELFAMGFFAAVVLMFLALGNGLVFRLPLSAQRTLAFLPGNWDPAVVRDAQDSTQWRLEMWQTVLTEERWIRNKLLGDGFGFTREDYYLMQNEQLGYHGFAEGIRQETQLIVGAYHSGPLSAIRYVGVVGLILFLILLIYTARRAYRLTMRCWNTKFFKPVAFVTLQAVLYPFIFVFVFGAFENDLSRALFTCGMIRLLDEGVTQESAMLPGEENKRRAF